jgi:hypothetical protein
MMAERMYVTVEEVLARSGSSLLQRDLGAVIAAVTDRFERETNRVFLVSELETRSFYATRDDYCVIDDLQSATSVQVNGATLSSDLYRLKNVTPQAAYHALLGEFERDAAIDIRGYWGTTETVPPDVKDAVITWVRRIIKADDAGGSNDVTAIPELGQLVYSKAIPADVKRVLDRWRRWV